MECLSSFGWRGSPRARKYFIVAQLLVKIVIVVPRLNVFSCCVRSCKFVRGSSGRPPSAPGLGAPPVLRLEGGAPELVNSLL